MFMRKLLLEMDGCVCVCSQYEILLGSYKWRSMNEREGFR